MVQEFATNVQTRNYLIRQPPPVGRVLSVTPLAYIGTVSAQLVAVKGCARMSHAAGGI